MMINLVFFALGLGWSVGYAQSSGPEFVLEIDAPVGRTSISCVEGCELLGMRDVINPNAGRLKAYFYECSGHHRCQAQVGGWGDG